MFNFNRAFLMKCPTGRWSFVGKVPLALHKRIVPASKEAVMGCRARTEGDEIVEYRAMTWETKQEAIDAIEAIGFPYQVTDL